MYSRKDRICTPHLRTAQAASKSIFRDTAIVLAVEIGRVEGDRFMRTQRGLGNSQAPNTHVATEENNLLPRQKRRFFPSANRPCRAKVSCGKRRRKVGTSAAGNGRGS